MNIDISKSLFDRAQKVMPGGVNSPVRAFNAVGGTPRFIKKAKGQYIYDENGNRYIDFIGSWGPMVLGHNDDRVLSAVKQQLELGMSYGAATALEVEMAELICDNISFVDMVRMVNSGTEAVMSAIRAARGFTGRDKVIKFEGCYHGHADLMLVKSGSGLLTAGKPSSDGVPQGCVKDTLTAKYNDLESVERLFSQNKDEIACVIVEPVAANMGVVPPRDGFLQGLRDICDKNNALLIFDEVITGFRLCFGGAAAYYNVTPDLVTYGKIIGGGMPVGAYGGRRDIMSCVAPLGGVYQAGTLSGNPVAMSAGIAQLEILRDNPAIYDRINSMGEYFRNGVKTLAEKYNVNVRVNGVGSISTVFFADNEAYDFDGAVGSDNEAFSAYFNYMLENGIHMGASRFEAIFISAAHTKADIDKALAYTERFFCKKSKTPQKKC